MCAESVDLPNERHVDLLHVDPAIPPRDVDGEVVVAGRFLEPTDAAWPYARRNRGRRHTRHRADRRVADPLPPVGESRTIHDAGLAPDRAGEHRPSTATQRRERSMSTLQPGPEHKFAFGLWTIGHPGRDPFGEVVRPPIEPWEFVYRLGDLGGLGGQLPRRRPRAPGRLGSRARRHPRPFPQGARLHRDGRVDGHDEPVLASGRSRTARSPPAIATSGATRSRRRCGRSISGPSSAPRPMSSGAAGKAPKRSRPSHPSTPWPATGRRSTSCAATCRDQRLSDSVRHRAEAERAAG